MQIECPKQYTSPQELVQLLKKRGLTISNETKAKEYLQNIGYYRLSAYFYPFLQTPKTNHLYKSGSAFKDVMNIYRFDRKLRLLMFNEIEKIEVAIRSTIVNITAEDTNNPFWITTSEVFADKNRFQRMMSLTDKEYNRSREDFIQHFRNTYINPYPPSWELIEILPLGILTRVYENIRSNQTRKKIAQRFFLNVPVFESWMTIITLTRNSCCHHSRVWNKENSITTRSMRRMIRPWINSEINQKRIYYNLCIIKYFLDIISPSNHFKGYLLDLFAKYPSVDKAGMGFPTNWEQEPLWLN